MENGREPSEVEENCVRKVMKRTNECAPRGLGRFSAHKLNDKAVLDKITFESERVKGSHSETSSRRNSDDGGRAKRDREGIREGILFIYSIITFCGIG